MLTLKAARIKNNWTQEQLAEACSITTVTISNLERGVTRPQKSTRNKLESILGAIDWTATENQGLIESNGAFAQSRNGTNDKHEILN